MLDKFKNNQLTIIVFCIFLLFGFIDVSQYIQYDNKRYIMDLKTYEECNNNEGIPELCSYYKNGAIKRDFINTFGYIIIDQNYIRNLQMLAPLLIMIAAGWTFHRFLKKGYFKNSLTRLSYKDAFIKLYLTAQKNALILPSFLFIIFICACFISKNFNIQYGITDIGNPFVNKYNAEHWISFLLVFFLNFILHGIFWINIIICNCKSNKNIIIAVVTSFMEYYLLWIILDYNISTLLLNTSLKEYLNLAGIWYYGNQTKFGTTLVSIILVIISSIAVYYTYHDKEKVLEEINK